jgi:hypothetical protein
MSLPPQIFEAQHLYAAAKQEAGRLGELREPALERLAEAAVDYANHVDKLKAVAEARQLQATQQAAALRQQRQQRPERERGAVVEYARTLLRPAPNVAQKTRAALDELAATPLRIPEISALTQKSANGDPVAAERLGQYEHSASAALRGFVALDEQRRIGDPQAAGALESLGPHAEEDLLRYAYSQREQIARGNGVTPEMAKLITHHKPRTPMQERILGELGEALTDAAYVYAGIRPYTETTIGNNEGDQRQEFVRTASQVTDPNIPVFVRESYVDDLSRVSVQGPLTPRQITILGRITQLRERRLYVAATRIQDVRAIPAPVREKYEEAIRRGQEAQAEQRHDRRVERAQRGVGVVKRAAGAVKKGMDAVAPYS